MTPTKKTAIDVMVDRFLGWKLPHDFAPDCGISFDGRKDDEWNKNKSWPIGTNLFHAEQARQLFEHVLPAPLTPAQSKAQFLADNLQPGEIYAGLILGKAGEPDHHLVLLPGETSASWSKAKAWAKEQGGELPTRREQSLLFANCKAEFKADWYWSGELHSDDRCAWFQYFYHGNQYGTLHGTELRARAVRRLIL